MTRSTIYLSAGSFFCLFFCSWWIYKSFPETGFFGVGNEKCRVQFHQWYSGRCVITRFKDDRSQGKTILSEGLFTHPFAVIPGPDSRSLICFSRLDTTFAVFAVEIQRRPSGEVKIADRFKQVVDFTEFPVRTCTTHEVDFVADLIGKTELSQLSKYVYGGVKSETQRANLARFLRRATTMPDLREPNARPQFLPES
jgi:hypothetical protein